jgi:hypothetical protein
MFPRSLVFLALSLAAAAQVHAAERPLTTQEAAALGLDANDATVVRTAEPTTGDIAHAPDDINGGSEFATYSAFAMRGSNGETQFNQTAAGRWCETSSDGAFGDIVLDLPDETQVQILRVYGYDTDADDDLTVSLIRRCLPTETSGSVLTTVLAELTPAQTGGNFTTSTSINPAVPIDTRSCSYTLRTRFSTPGSPNLCAGSNLRLQKVRLQIVPP